MKVLITLALTSRRAVAAVGFFYGMMVVGGLVWSGKSPHWLITDKNRNDEKLTNCPTGNNGLAAPSPREFFFVLIAPPEDKILIPFVKSLSISSLLSFHPISSCVATALKLNPLFSKNTLLNGSAPVLYSYPQKLRVLSKI